MRGYFYARVFLWCIMVQFTKQFRTNRELLSILENRGVVISDKVRAEEFLDYVNYYRLTGYLSSFRPQKSSDDSFLPNTDFENVRRLYIFDRQLRSLVFEGVAIIEIYVRALISSCLGLKGPFVHFDETMFTPYFNKKKKKIWYACHEREIIRSQEACVRHFQETYDEWPRLPIWVSVELMSFGTISRFYEGLDKPYKEHIAQNFGQRSKVFQSWLHAVAYVRNVCAHHARFWNRVLSIRPMIPKNNAAWSCFSRPSVSKRPFLVLAVINHILKNIKTNTNMDVQWGIKMQQLLSDPPPVPNFEHAMGLPSQWKNFLL